MKRKKPAAPVPAAAVEQPAAQEKLKTSGLSPLDIGKIVVFSLLLFVSMTLQTGQMSMILVVLALLSFIGREPFRLMGERLSLPVIGLLGFMVMALCAAVYSHFGSYAAGELNKYLAAFSLALILLARFEKKHVPGLLWGFAAVSAAISLLCIDAASASWLFDAFTRFIEALGGSYAEVEQDIWGTRVAGIYNDANVSASILALGSLVSLYLADSGKTLWKKVLACVLLGISAMGFFLSVSRGAILCFALALLVWLIAAGKGNRLSLFFLMFFSDVTVVALSIPAIRGISSGSFLPVMLALLCGLVIFALNWAVGSRLAHVLEGKGKLIAAVGGVLALLCVGYCVAAMTVTGPYTLEADEILVRNLSVAPGTYTLSGEWDGDIKVIVRSQTKEQVVSSSATILYSGFDEQITFTVPEDTLDLSIWFEGRNGARLETVTLSDGTKIPLGYPLLPSFIANRLQDSLFSSISFLLRVQYLKDGWTLFTQSPLLGHGLGSTEGLYTSVQPFFYASKYAHNHVLQVMTDMGLLGAAGFLALLGGVLWLLLKNLRSGTGLLAALLLACWVMMNTHSLMEINFSVRGYLCAALCLLLLPVLLYAEPLKVKAAKMGSAVLAALLWLTLAVSGGLMEGHRMVEKASQDFSAEDAYTFLEGVRNFAKRDVFDNEYYKLTFVGNTATVKDSRFTRDTRIFAEDLRESGTYTACSGLARYYYLPRGEYKELFACSREGIAQEASTNEAWNLQLDFYRTEVFEAMAEEHLELFLDEVLKTKDYLETYSQGRMEEIQLSEENVRFLNLVSSVREQGLTEQQALPLLMAVLNG